LGGWRQIADRLGNCAHFWELLGSESDTDRPVKKRAGIPTQLPGVNSRDAPRPWRSSRDRQIQTVVGYYDGSWTTDRRGALDLRKREVAESHAARMHERCPRNADLIKVEELDAAN
jgi:hypothetical protein